MKDLEINEIDVSGNYTDNFGFQWNKFIETQLDRDKQGIIQSRQRFLAVTGWDKEDLSREKILEVGAGAGRFTAVALDTTKAEVYAVDYSDAVIANQKNNGPHPRLHIQKASVYHLPFPKQSFGKVFCFGMLQHTPDPMRTVECLADMVKSGGELIVDFYPYKGWHTKIHAKYLLRPFTRKMDHQKLLHWIESNIAGLIQLYKGLHRLKLGIFTRFLPLVDIYKVLPSGLSAEQEKEWATLDTFDMFSPRYDKPQKMEDVKRWMVESGLNISFACNIEYDEKHIVSVVKGVRPCVG